MEVISQKVPSAVYRVSVSEALSHSDWLVKNHCPVQYCDFKGIWQTRILTDVRELELIASMNGWVFIPLPPKGGELSVSLPEDQDLLKDLGHIASLTPEQRLEILQDTVSRLNQLRSNPHARQEKIQVIIQGTRSAFLINKQTFEVRDFTQEQLESVSSIKKETQVFVGKVTEQLRQQGGYAFLLELLKTVASGATMDHVTRVFNQTLGFFLFFNERLNTRSLAAWWRTHFPKVFAPYYRRLLPRLDTPVLESVFPGLSRMTEPQLLEAGLGALFHDIGKVPELEYFESSEGYDREKVMQHTFSGYGILTRTYEKNRCAALMAGSHHEYYGHPLGYGIFRSIYDPLAQARGVRPSSALTMDVLQAESRQSLAYFPAKILEIVDIFDALTDPGRAALGRKVHSVREALEVLRKSFLEEDLKIDPLLFDLFCRFLVEEGEDAGVMDFSLVQD